MSSSNAEYFARRCDQERAAAASASDPHIAAVHAQMAELYATAAEVAAQPAETPMAIVASPAAA